MSNNIIPSRLVRARASYNSAQDRVIGLEMQILIEEGRAAQQNRKPNPDLIARVEAELVDARQALANAGSIRTGNEAMAMFPPLTHQKVLERVAATAA